MRRATPLHKFECSLVFEGDYDFSSEEFADSVYALLTDNNVEDFLLGALYHFRDGNWRLSFDISAVDEHAASVDVSIAGRKWFRDMYVRHEIQRVNEPTYTSEDRKNYPLLCKAGIKIVRVHPGPPGCDRMSTHRAFSRANLHESWEKWACGGITMCSNGVYPWDVEAFLSKKPNYD